MFKKKPGINSEKIDTLIGEGTEFNGKISASGIVRIDGKIEGEIFTEGDLIIGEKGKVKANATGKNITIAGEISGNIECNGKLELLPTAKLVGDIKVSDLYIYSGATFEGNCEMNYNKDYPAAKEKNKGKGTDKNKAKNKVENKDSKINPS